MLRTDPGRRPYQVPGVVLVALGAARAVHDRRDPVDCGLDPLAGGQIAGHELDAVPGLVAAPTEHPQDHDAGDVGADVLAQAADDDTESRGTAGEHQHAASAPAVGENPERDLQQRNGRSVGTAISAIRAGVKPSWVMRTFSTGTHGAMLSSRSATCKGRRRDGVR